jgi:predicted DsbA family dithiol-disulfide isomerase
LKREYEVAVRWTAYPLRPDTPEEGLALEHIFPGKDLDEMNVRLKRAAKKAGLPFGYRTMTYNSRFAHELSKWAESEGYGDEFHITVFRAYYVDGKNIGKIPVLIELVKRLGLSQKEAKKVIETRAFKDAVDSDWSRSLQVDPEYIPSLMINGQLLVNPQKYELYEQLMRAKNIKETER